MCDAGPSLPERRSGTGVIPVKHNHGSFRAGVGLELLWLAILDLGHLADLVARFGHGYVLYPLTEPQLWFDDLLLCLLILVLWHLFDNSDMLQP